MGPDVRKPVFSGLRTTKAQTSLCIRTVWSAPLSLAYWKLSNIGLLRAKKFNFLASLCSWGDLFETCFVANPEDRFSHDKAHIRSAIICPFFITKLSSKGCIHLATCMERKNRLGDRHWQHSLTMFLVFCRSWSGYKLIAKIVSRQQKSPLARKEQSTKFSI